jgi:hypothetical protein
MPKRVARAPWKGDAHWGTGNANAKRRLDRLRAHAAGMENIQRLEAMLESFRQWQQHRSPKGIELFLRRCWFTIKRIW